MSQKIEWKFRDTQAKKDKIICTNCIHTSFCWNGNPKWNCKINVWTFYDKENNTCKYFEKIIK